MPVYQAETFWSLNHAPAVSTQATVSKAAGAAGVKHVAVAVTFGFSAGTALAGATTITVSLRDGATGAGTVLKSWQFSLPAAVVAPFAIQLSDMHVKGSPATAMTLEFGSNPTNLLQFVNIDGYDES